MAWNKENGTIVTANLTPTSIQDTYPTHVDIYGRGGFKAVTSLEERDAIKISRLCLGAEVRVTDANGSIVYYVSKMPSTITDEMTGKDCEWTVVGNKGFDEEALEAIKGQPNGLAGLDSEGKIPEINSRGMVYVGEYISETEFKSLSGLFYTGIENAIYVDKLGAIYTFTDNKFRKNTLYWTEV